MATVVNTNIAHAQGIYKNELDLFIRGEGGKRVRGHVRVRCHGDGEAPEICAQTWEIAWERGLTYDPRRELIGYFLYWANIMLCRHYRQAGRNKRYQRLRSELGGDPDRQTEDEFVDEDLTWRPDEAVPEALDAAEKLAGLERIFEVTFNGDHPPHQLIAFGFLKVLELKPRELVAQYSQTSLHDLAQTLERQYARDSGLSAARVTRYFNKLRANLQLPLGEIVKHSKQRTALAGKLDRISGEMALEDFYKPQSESADARGRDVVQWRFAAERRAAKDLKRVGIVA